MKTTVRIEKEVDIAAILIDIAPRYIGDGEDYDMPTDFPMLNSEKTAWVAKVDIDTGQIFGWPAGEVRKMHVKVCDAGIYTLYDREGVEIAVFNGYVPNDVVPGSYGDYVELEIDGSGIITNWPKHPDVSRFFELDD